VPDTPNPTLAAFLRGIEPRADVLLRAFAGPELDSAALLARIRGDFAALSARLPPAEWPLRYWGLLLAAPELQSEGRGLPRHPLYDLTPTRRLALLLRLVVGLEPVGAARLLGLSEAAFRALWRDAEDKLAEAGVGPAVLLRWQESFQQQVRATASARPDAALAASATASARPDAALAASATASARPDAALAASTTTPGRVGASAAAGATRPSTRRSWSPQRVALSLLLGVLLLALAATFLWPPGRGSAPAADGPPQPLAAPVPAPREAGLEERLLVDPDLEMLLAPEDAPWRLGVGLLSWWSAQRGDALPALGPAAPVPVAVDWAALPASLRARLAGVEAAWPALTAAEQAALRARAEAWQALTPERRAALRAAYAEWLTRPALKRSALRATHAEWRALEAGEQQALTALAADWRALPEADRQALAAAFAALPAAEREDWGLGPRLGRQLPGLRPLLAFVPADQQVALIEALEGLDDAQRAALAERLARMGTAQRAALRAEVLAAEPAARDALLRAAAAR
jgi:hypothetical protein